ncbi:MAG: 2-C-methyl-D-erythritol 2,4-cyclodiphosphate synthase [Desulfobacteraceae bacterium]|nr:MAG: 2-C-methyl-D-erythritol 2,4-cyclodiphosphate synthase [Desulfobacteraceae bacterium]
MRVGFGYDVHRLVAGRDLILGGVKIPHVLGLLGHSDADVLTHAVMDAILGALAQGDIGRHFPDTDPAYKDIASLVLLARVMALVKQNRSRINNVDVTILAQNPKLMPYMAEMRRNLAEVMEIGIEDVNIKATTTEGLGFVGREQGMAAYAVVSINET